MTRIGTVALLLLCTAPAGAQTEILVNTVMDSTQRDPQIACDAAGNAVVVWESRHTSSGGSGSMIHLQRLTSGLQPGGTDAMVNAPGDGLRERPAVAMNGAGDLVVVWASYSGRDSMYDIKARHYPHGGSPGPEVFVNTTMAATQTNPDVAMDETGKFVVVWESWHQDGSDRGVVGRRYGADGEPIGPEFQVNAHTAYSQARPSVAMWPDGRFVTVWESWRQEGSAASGYGVYGRLWTAAGIADTDEIHVNATTPDYQWYADVLALDDGSFVVAWCSWEQDGEDGGVYLRRFAGSGAALTGEIQVNQNVPYYQWLPRLTKTADGGVAVMWSSWKQDGDREGVYARRYAAGLSRASFETRVNDIATGFQWEPDCAGLPDGRTVGVWSTWRGVGTDYDIALRTVDPVWPEGYLEPAGLAIAGGRTTSTIVVHVVDSTAMTGHTYSVRFDTAGRTATATIRDTVTGQVRATLPMNLGEGYFYLSPPFDGIAVQMVPEFDLAVDAARSTSITPGGTNLAFTAIASGAGVKRLAPIDAVIEWGNADTLSDGSYEAPLDTAINNFGQRVVAVPFRAWNLTEGGRIDLWVVDTDNSRHWDPPERIVLRTPPPYRVQPNNTHAEVTTTMPGGPILMPAAGDSTFVRTTRPLTPQDVFLFNTAGGIVLDGAEGKTFPTEFRLEQNYPNPFNPTTEIRYQVSGVSDVKLVVYDLLGREVATLVDEPQAPGRYEMRFDGRNLASGVYLYRLTAGGRAVVRKMMLVK